MQQEALGLSSIQVKASNRRCEDLQAIVNIEADMVGLDFERLAADRGPPTGRAQSRNHLRGKP